MWTRYRALILYVIAFLNEAKGTGTQWNEDESGQLGCMAPGQLCYQGKLHSEEDLNDADERCQPKQVLIYHYLILNLSAKKNMTIPCQFVSRTEMVDAAVVILASNTIS